MATTVNNTLIRSLYTEILAQIVWAHEPRKDLTVTHTLLLHPGSQMLNFLETKLYPEVEGTCSGQFGYTIVVISILDIGKGMVLRGMQAKFVVKYRAVVFKPFKREVVDGAAKNMNKVCHE